MEADLRPKLDGAFAEVQSTPQLTTFDAPHGARPLFWLRQIYRASLATSTCQRGLRRRSTAHQRLLVSRENDGELIDPISSKPPRGAGSCQAGMVLRALRMSNTVGDQRRQGCRLPASVRGRLRQEVILHPRIQATGHP